MSGIRILFANDGIGDGGGVQTYLAAVMPALVQRGHTIAFLHVDIASGRDTPAAGAPHFGIDELGIDRACGAVREWHPDVCFSHNMSRLEVDERLLAEWPVVKMMHGYFGTCVGGQKAHMFPSPVPCGRRLGMPCLALYLPRRCGSLSVGTMLREYEWAKRQHALLDSYARIVVASDHMRHEYLHNGVSNDKVTAIPLFSTLPPVQTPPKPAAGPLRVLFLGRMTKLKGGKVLIRAAHRARARGADVQLVLAGDGPQREPWRKLCERLGVPAEMPGWVDPAARARLFADASVLALPSVWPEPFGLVGPEAGSYAVPAIAFDVGGVSEWLHDGENGYLLRSNPNDSDALAEALVHLHKHPDERARLGDGALRTARELSVERHVTQLVSVLLGAAQTRKPAGVEQRA
jgi:glycosyltransferase involved in cell wall biosynthesis